MDERIRDLERRAKGGDLDAAIRWFYEASRLNDLQAVFEAMQLIGELQHPGLMKTLRDIAEVNRVLKLMQPPVEDSYEWRTWDSSNPPDIWVDSGINPHAPGIGIEVTPLSILPAASQAPTPMASNLRQA